MMRDRLLHPRWLVYLIVVWGVTLAAMPHPAGAAPLPPTREGATGRDLEGVRALLERRIIRDRLATLGVSTADAMATIERLSPTERTELAARVDELETGSGAVEAIAFSIIVALLVILILELMGRRVISRP